MSCTHYDPPPEAEFQESNITQYVKAHTALGGGQLALFGTGCLHTWAGDISEITNCFTDVTVIDKRKLFDDSCGRFVAILNLTFNGVELKIWSV